MTQVKIYQLKKADKNMNSRISNVIHGCLEKIFKLPNNKRFHRFLELDKYDFIYPDDRSTDYTILEIYMMTGRTQETKRKLMRELFVQFEAQLNILPTDLEILLIESAPENWGFRGISGDEAILNYPINH